MTFLDAVGDEGGEGGEILGEPDGGEDAAQIFIRQDGSEAESGVDGGKGVARTADGAGDDGKREVSLEGIAGDFPCCEWTLDAALTRIIERGSGDGAGVLAEGSCGGEDAVEDAFIVGDGALWACDGKAGSEFDFMRELVAGNLFAVAVELFEGKLYGCVDEPSGGCVRQNGHDAFDGGVGEGLCDVAFHGVQNGFCHGVDGIGTHDIDGVDVEFSDDEGLFEAGLLETFKREIEGTAAGGNEPGIGLVRDFEPSFVTTYEVGVHIECHHGIGRRKDDLCARDGFEKAGVDAATAFKESSGGVCSRDDARLFRDHGDGTPDAVNTDGSQDGQGEPKSPDDIFAHAVEGIERSGLCRVEQRIERFFGGDRAECLASFFEVKAVETGDMGHGGDPWQVESS